MRDVIVVGGGPAGSLAAYHLARAGVRVALLEKERLPRYKTCGGGVVQRARPLLPIDLDRVAERSCPAAEIVTSEGLLVARVERRPGPLVTLVMRSAFDHALVAAAEEAGAEILCPEELRSLESGEKELVAVTGTGRLRARFLVGADGALSTVARLAGWPRRRPGIPALEWEISLPEGASERLVSPPVFHFQAGRAGYAWVFPKRERLSVGILSTRCDRDLAAGLRTSLAGARIDPDRWPTARHGFVIPERPREAPLARGRVLLCGDAAGLADPVTFEGITHALLSGRLAAEALVEGQLDPDAVGRAYGSALEKQVLGELRHARLLARLLYRVPRLRRLAFRRRGTQLGEAMAGVMAGELSYRSLLRSPAHSLRLLRGDRGARLH